MYDSSFRKHLLQGRMRNWENSRLGYWVESALWLLLSPLRREILEHVSHGDDPSEGEN